MLRYSVRKHAVTMRNDCCIQPAPRAHALLSIRFGEEGGGGESICASALYFQLDRGLHSTDGCACSPADHVGGPVRVANGAGAPPAVIAAHLSARAASCRRPPGGTPSGPAAMRAAWRRPTATPARTTNPAFRIASIAAELVPHEVSGARRSAGEEICALRQHSTGSRTQYLPSSPSYSCVWDYLRHLVTTRPYRGGNSCGTQRPLC